MDYQLTAESVLRGVGGAPNVVAVEHCSTRLRFNLADDSKADISALKEVPGVLGVVNTGQTQVIIGNEVIEVYDALVRLPGVKDRAGATTVVGAPKKKKGWAHPGRILLDFLVGVFQPLVPVIAGAGILKSLLILLGVLGWMDTTGQNYLVLISIPNAVFYFLPLMVAVTTATKLNSNKLLALAAVSVLILPSLSTLVAAEGGAHLLGFQISNVNYSTQVFPAILSTLFLAWMERVWTRWSPKPIRIFFVSMMCLLITVPLELLVFGPLGYNAGVYFTSAIFWVYSTFGWVATALLATLLPFLVSVGMHKALLPPTIAQISATGSESLYQPASLAHNLSESGASFAVAIRTKSETLRTVALSAGISGAFGITEPALYGITLQNKRALYSVLIGCFTGGAYLGLTHVAGFVAVGPGIASLSSFIDPTNPANLINALVGAGISFLVSMIVCLVLWRDSKSGTLLVEHDPAAGPAGDIYADEDTDAGVQQTVRSPMSGTILPLSEVKDKVFAAGVLGAGIAVVPDSGEVHAPVDGIITMIFDSKHAIGITTSDGVELLIHVGLDTVRLNGQHFDPVVAKGDHVTAGQLLMNVDLDGISEAGYDTTTPIVVTNSNKFVVNPTNVGRAAIGDPVITVSSKETAGVS
jgi:PTS system beta-glucosides-specific IIC component